MEKEVVKTLIEAEEVEKRVTELAEQITEDFKEKDLLILCLLKGSVFFTASLAKQIDLDMAFEFIELSSYGIGTESSRVIELKKDMKHSIVGKDVLVIEDIVDTGRTLNYLLEHLKSKEPKSIKLCTLLDKPERREVPVKVDYVGFEIPNKFVVGYGLDYAQKYRNLPYVGYLDV